MKKLFFFLLFGFLWLEIQATHIVGGGFSYRRISGTDYRFTLTLYFDLINGNQAARDPDATCHIFSKSTNSFMGSYFFNLVSSGIEVPFSNPNCATAGLVRTEIMVYEATINLAATVFTDTSGYYIVWERCCRNGGISNIISPGETGQTFYMEFPPVRRNNLNYINNSPVFTQITSDYPCINNPFQLSFQATDPDGDSLAYSLTTPLRGNSNRNDPRPLDPIPGPYTLVSWAPGFSTQVSIPGNPALQVDKKTGLLNLNASQQGLFVFSVLCSEFRGKKKIGEVRREMQLLVKACQPNDPPVIIATNPLSGLLLQDNDTLSLEGKPQSFCQLLKLTDKQLNQGVRFQAFPYSASTPSDISKDTIVRILTVGDSVKVRVCIPACAQTDPFQLWRVLLTATDQACGNPESDSLILYLKIKKPEIFAPVLNVSGYLADTIRIVQTEKFEMGFDGIQSQNANLVISSTLTDALGQTIPVQTNRITLPSGAGRGRASGPFSWPEICFLPENQPLKLICILRSTLCSETKTDTIIRWIFISPKDLDVNIFSSLNSEFNPGQAIPLKISEVGKGLNFDLTGTASENRDVRLFANGSLTQIPTFQFPGGEGSGQVVSPFRFSSDCQTPNGPFRVTFFSESRFCNRNIRDSISYLIDFKEDSEEIGPIPNLLTLNGDGKNDFFSMENILPNNNCKVQFKFIRVVNRWGKEVFYSEDIGFRWDASNLEPGNYFLLMEFNQKSYKDWIYLLK
jgi:hypothetical protein